jgi:ABC-type glycerol-3-phosphate transport system substrate-binding protein
MNWISSAVAGEVTPDEALDGLAKEIDQTMEKLGY